MLNGSSFDRNVESLRKDANRMLEDLGRLQADIVKTGRFNTEKVAGKLSDAVATRLDQSLQTLSVGFGTMVDRVNRINAETKRQLQVIDTTMHKRPYSYYALCGAVAVGVIGGMLMPVGRRGT